MQTAAEKIAIVKRMAAELRAMFPGRCVELGANEDGRVTINMHNIPTYRLGTQILQALSVGKRMKQTHDTDGRAWSVLIGEEDGVRFQVFCNTLPPTCKLERYVERVPKTQTVESGEYVEVERTRIVCG